MKGSVSRFKHYDTIKKENRANSKVSLATLSSAKKSSLTHDHFFGGNIRESIKHEFRLALQDNVQGKNGYYQKYNI
jgi:hypothetical protein